MKVFENFDGGGFNHYIVEFRRAEDLIAFMDQIETTGRSWVESGPRDDGSC